MKIKKNNYEIGDIVFVSEYKYKDGSSGNGLLFVIIDKEMNELVSIEYFGLIISSRVYKQKNLSKYQYNELLKKSKLNGLLCDSIVKCDVLYNIPRENILFKIGSIDIDDYIKFINVYKNIMEKSI